MAKTPLNLFLISENEPVSVRIVQPSHPAGFGARSSITIGGQPVLGIDLAPVQAQEVRKLDLAVDRPAGAPGKLEIEVQAGDRIFRRSIDLARGLQDVRLHFVTQATRLIFCPVLDDYVVPDSNGKCSNCHVDHPA